jgi:hypothetical protein
LQVPHGIISQEKTSFIATALKASGVELFSYMGRLLIYTFDDW